MDGSVDGCLHMDTQSDICHVCMHLFIHIYIYIYVSLCVSLPLSLSLSLSLSKKKCIYIYIYMYVCITLPQLTLGGKDPEGTGRIEDMCSHSE